MDDLENTVTLIFTFISSVVILIYYLNPKQLNYLDSNLRTNSVTDCLVMDSYQGELV